MSRPAGYTILKQAGCRPSGTIYHDQALLPFLSTLLRPPPVLRLAGFFLLRTSKGEARRSCQPKARRASIARPARTRAPAGGLIYGPVVKKKCHLLGQAVAEPGYQQRKKTNFCFLFHVSPPVDESIRLCAEACSCANETACRSAVHVPVRQRSFQLPWPLG